MNTTLIKYGLVGTAGLLLLLSLKKRKRSIPPALSAPKTYMPVKGDRPTAVAARFGTDFTTVFNFNKQQAMFAGKPWLIPPGLKDSGPRPQAMGIVT